MNSSHRLEQLFASSSPTAAHSDAELFLFTGFLTLCPDNEKIYTPT